MRNLMNFIKRLFGYGQPKPKRRQVSVTFNDGSTATYNSIHEIGRNK